MNKKVQIRLGVFIVAAAAFAGADGDVPFIISFFVLMAVYVWYMVGVFKESDNV